MNYSLYAPPRLLVKAGNRYHLSSQGYSPP